MIRHAGLVAIRQNGLWCGALIEGESGAGKSDLALRCLDLGFRLVADDRTLVWRSGEGLFGRAPAPLAGLIEARGQGVLTEAALPLAQIVLLVTCVGDPAQIERMPDVERETLLGATTERIFLDAREPSAPAKLRRAMQHLGVSSQQAYQAASRGGGGRAGTGNIP